MKIVVKNFHQETKDSFEITPVYFTNFNVDFNEFNEDLFLKKVKNIICQLFNDLHLSKDKRVGTLKLLIDSVKNTAEIYEYKPFLDITDFREGTDEFNAVTFIIDYRYKKDPISEFQPFTVRNLEVFSVFYEHKFIGF